MMNKIQILQYKKVLFDVDDVLWGLTRKTAQDLNIPYEKLQEFHIMSNGLLSLVEQLAIDEHFRDPRTFQNIEFYNGVEDMITLRQYGMEPYVKTNSLSQGVIAVKRPQILEAIPGIQPEHVSFGLVDEHTTLNKEIEDDILIAVDDSPYNIRTSHAKYNIMPRMPHNQTAKASEMMADKIVYPVKAGDMYGIYAMMKDLSYGITWRDA